MAFKLANSDDVNIYSRRDGDIAVFVVNDQEASRLSAEIIVNCVPLA